MQLNQIFAGREQLLRAQITKTSGDDDDADVSLKKKVVKLRRGLKNRVRSPRHRHTYSCATEHAA